MTKKKVIISVLVLIAVAIIGINLVYFNGMENSPEEIKIGIVTPLTGDAGFWGQSSVSGSKLAKQDLEKQGINVEFIFEDGQLDPKKALSAAQKLVNVDGVDAVYSEFAPAAISVSSFLKDKQKLYVYDAAIESPLKDSENNYKTYIDYKENCKSVAFYLKEKNVEKVGILKMNLEFAELCDEGIREVYDNVVVEAYNPGESDFRTMLTKMKDKDVGAIFNPAFPAEAQGTLTQINKLGMEVYSIVVSDSLLGGFVKDNANLLGKTLTFGFPDVSEDFIGRLNTNVPAPEAAAVAYTHLTQLAKAISSCAGDIVCERSRLGSSPSTNEIGFNGFKNKIAMFEITIKRWNGNKFVEVA
jgi:ABC-type branched-subunit amino acid transport system substrate-binding protein